MTTEDEKLICDYMGWDEDNFFKGYRTLDGHAINFDPNDASLVAAEMQKRGEWDEFLQHCYIHTPAEDDFIAHLFNSENFFKAFVEWRKRNETQR